MILSYFKGESPICVAFFVWDKAQLEIQAAVMEIYQK